MNYEVVIDEVCIESGNITLKGKSNITLRRFQEDTVKFFCSTNRFLFLTAPTGSGKTFTLISPLIANILCDLSSLSYEGVLGIYPTKPLTTDQFLSMKSMLSKLGDIKKEVSDSLAIYEASFKLEGGDVVKEWCGKIGLIKLTRDDLEKLSKKLEEETKYRIMKLIRDELVNEDISYLITITVPEYPYLMFSSLYRSHLDMSKLLSLAAEGGLVYSIAKKIATLNDDKLTREVNRIHRIMRDVIGGRAREREFADMVDAILPRVMFLDEFHTWGVYEKPTVLSLVIMHYLLSTITSFPEVYRVIFSSATPQDDIVKVLRVIVPNGLSLVKADAVDCRHTGSVKIRGRTEVEFVPIKVKAYGSTSWLLVDDYLPKIVAEKASEILESGRVIVFGRRVCSVEEAAKEFYKKTGVAPVLVTGVKPPKEFLDKEHLINRRDKGELYVFGNYSIELGVDLANIRYVIALAGSLGELIQRMGRGGRGGIDSKLVIPIPHYYLSDVMRHIVRNPIKYWDFINALSLVLPSEIIVRRIGGNLILGHELGKLRMYLPMAVLILSLIHRFKDKPRDLKEVLSEFVRIVDKLELSKIFHWLATKVSKSPKVLIGIASFRMSPTVPYARRESPPDAIDGEDNFITLLANYDVSLDSRRGRLVLVLNNPRRKSVRHVSTICMHADEDLINSLHGVVLTSDKLLEILPVELRVRNYVVSILKHYPIPVYVSGISKVMELLQAFGYALKLDVNGFPIAYLVLA